MDIRVGMSAPEALKEFLDNVDYDKMALMGKTMTATYSQDAMHEMLEYVTEKRWNNGEEMMAYVSMIAASMFKLPKKYRASFLGAFVVSVALMIQDIEELNSVPPMGGTQ